MKRRRERVPGEWSDMFAWALVIFFVAFSYLVAYATSLLFERGR